VTPVLAPQQVGQGKTGPQADTLLKRGITSPMNSVVQEPVLSRGGQVMG
jgi:hypothetical protein